MPPSEKELTSTTSPPPLLAGGGGAIEEGVGEWRGLPPIPFPPLPLLRAAGMNSGTPPTASWLIFFMPEEGAGGVEEGEAEEAAAGV